MSTYPERLALYNKRVAEIKAHNAAGNSSFTMGVSELTFLTEEELAMRINPMLPQDCSATAEITKKRVKKPIDLSMIPSSLDWRDTGKVSPVKN